MKSWKNYVQEINLQMLNVARKELSWKMLSLSMGVQIYRIHPFLYLLVFVLNMKIQQTVKFNEHNFMVSSEWTTEKRSQTTLTEHNFTLNMLCWVPDWTHLFLEIFLKNFFGRLLFGKALANLRVVDHVISIWKLNVTKKSEPISSFHSFS